MIFYWLSVIANGFLEYDFTIFQIVFLMFFCGVYIIKKNTFLGKQLLLALITFPIYLLGLDIIIYTLFTVFNCCIAYFLYKRLELYQPEYNKNNVCIAFYKGENNRVIGTISSMLDLDVSSVDILHKSKIWRYKSGKLVETSIKNTMNEYIFIDTGVKATKETRKKLIETSKIPYKKSIFKPNCVLILADFLEYLDVKPKKWREYIPSFYLRSLLHGQ